MAARRPESAYWETQAPPAVSVPPPASHKPAAAFAADIPRPPPLSVSHHSLFSSKPPSGAVVKLFADKAEKEMYEDMSAVFSLLTATERLENIWARRGAIAQNDYEQQCDKLIQQFRVLRTSTEKSIPNIDKFIAEYECKASKARPRLKAGVPATVHSVSNTPKDLGKFVMRCTTLFHYCISCIDMNQRAVNVLLPDLTSLMKTLARVPALGNNFEFGHKIRMWVEKLNAMPANEELTEQDAAQLKLDLDNGYAEFERAYND
ncbi:Vacuolar protein sorting-associated Vps28 [Gracilaria domingensis]|nr:Vacuolar protein sorting-associated Vps28 [Gracilaria domingensis]